MNKHIVKHIGTGGEEKFRPDFLQIPRNQDDIPDTGIPVVRCVIFIGTHCDLILLPKRGTREQQFYAHTLVTCALYRRGHRNVLEDQWKLRTGN